MHRMTYETKKQKVEIVRIAYLDCSTGISGDMTLGALFDVGVEEAAVCEGIASLDLPGVRVVVDTVMKGDFRAKHVRIEHPEQHAHRHLGDIVELIDKAGAISESQRTLAKAIFRDVAAAEAKVHGATVEEVHFHEVGAIDSIVDIVGAAIGFDLLAADRVVCSPLPTGRGQIRIAHGICTVPAPGTAELLKGIPLADVPIEAELTTPTGAAIVKNVADHFGTLPEMQIEEIGYGAGTKNFAARANLLRIFVGTAVASPDVDYVALLETNLDDVTGEVIGYTKQKLFNAGALDVYTTAIQMKKDRPGVILSVICRPADRESLEAILFAETGTMGIRHHVLQRSKRARDVQNVETVWGTIRGKIGWRHGEPAVFTPEFEFCAKAASKHGVTLREVYRAAENAYQPQQQSALDTPDSHPGHDHDHSHDHSHDHDHGTDGHRH